MREWVKVAAGATMLFCVVLCALLEAWYWYELGEIQGRPTPAEMAPSDDFLSAARFIEGADSLEPCPALQIGGTFILIDTVTATLGLRQRKAPRCGRVEETISAGFLASTQSGKLRRHSRRFALSIWIARHLSPDQARAAWAHFGWFGHGNLQASSEWFFRKSPSELRQGERVALLLAHRHGGYKLSLVRRNQTLDLMRETGMIDDAVWHAERGRPFPDAPSE